MAISKMANDAMAWSVLAPVLGLASYASFRKGWREQQKMHEIDNNYKLPEGSKRFRKSLLYPKLYTASGAVLGAEALAAAALAYANSR